MQLARLAPLLLIWIVLIATILTLGLSLSRSPHALRVAKVCRALAIAVASIALVGIVLGIVDARETMSVAELSTADRQRIWSNGLAEALYNTGLTALVTVPALLAARFAFGRARR